MSTERGNLLLFGGTDFVGGEILKYATSQGYKVVAVSRRGVPPEGTPANPNVDWRKGNAVDPSLAPTILSEGGFTGVVHAVGMLFEGDINRLASGSGSVPSPGSTYDDVTRKTALNALAAVTNAAADRTLPFACVSGGAVEFRRRLRGHAGRVAAPLPRRQARRRRRAPRRRRRRPRPSHHRPAQPRLDLVQARVRPPPRAPASVYMLPLELCALVLFYLHVPTNKRRAMLLYSLFPAPFPGSTIESSPNSSRRARRALLPVAACTVGNRLKYMSFL